MLLAKTNREERSAVFSTRSALLVNDISDRMRVNSAALTLGGFTSPVGTYASMTGTVTAPTCGGLFVNPPSTTLNLPACSTALSSATYDFAAWDVEVQRSLPGGVGLILAGSAGPTSRQIVLAWIESVADKNGTGSTVAVNQDCPPIMLAPTNVRCYFVDFRL